MKINNSFNFIKFSFIFIEIKLNKFLLDEEGQSSSICLCFHLENNMIKNHY
jgi:hypothetical protein